MSGYDSFIMSGLEQDDLYQLMFHRNLFMVA